MKGWTCKHTGNEVRVGSQTGETIHRVAVSAYRPYSEIRAEIVELERLMKGMCELKMLLAIL